MQAMRSTELQIEVSSSASLARPAPLELQLNRIGQEKSIKLFGGGQEGASPTLSAEYLAGKFS
jgi:hypothetical protein